MMKTLFMLLLFQIGGSMSFSQDGTPDTINGIIWYPPVQLSNDTIESLSPFIAVSGTDTAHVTWNTFDSSYAIMKLPYVRVINGVVEPARDLIIDSVAFPFRAEHPRIAAEGSNVWITFDYGSPDQYHKPPLYMVRSTNGGTDWNPPIAISPGAAQLSGDFRQDGMDLAILYYPWPGTVESPVILRSRNSGDSWSQAPELLEKWAKIALQSGTLHLVQDTMCQGANEIEYRRSSDLGTSWQVDTVITDQDGIYSDIPTVSAHVSECGTELLAAWRDAKYGGVGFAGGSILAKTSLHNGDTWGPEFRLTTVPNGFEPVSALRGNARAVGWNAEVVAWDSIHAIVTGTNTSLGGFPPPLDLVYTAPPEQGRILTQGQVQTGVSQTAVHVVYEALIGNTFRVFHRRGVFVPHDVALSMSRAMVFMGNAELSISKDTVLMVGNSGTEPLTIGTIITEAAGAFTVEPESVTVQPGASAPVTVRFTPASPGEHEGRIIVYHNGLTSPDCFSVSGVGVYAVRTIPAEPGGWNLVSVPVAPGPKTSPPSLFGFSHEYISSDSMIFGKGYWAKPLDSVITYQGTLSSTVTVPLAKGWNLIGSVSNPVAVTELFSEPDTLLTGLIYGYKNGVYAHADTLQPGKAYWLKTRIEGSLTIQSTLKSRKEKGKAE